MAGLKPESSIATLNARGLAGSGSPGAKGVPSPVTGGAGAGVCDWHETDIIKPKTRAKENMM
jgi:hypothetical protein